MSLFEEALEGCFKTHPTRREDFSSNAIHENTVDAFIPGIGIGYTVSDTLNVFGGVHKGFASPRLSQESELMLGEQVIQNILKQSIDIFIREFMLMKICYLPTLLKNTIQTLKNSTHRIYFL